MDISTRYQQQQFPNQTIQKQGIAESAAMCRLDMLDSAATVEKVEAVVASATPKYSPTSGRSSTSLTNRSIVTIDENRPKEEINPLDQLLQLQAPLQLKAWLDNNTDYSAEEIYAHVMDQSNLAAKIFFLQEVVIKFVLSYEQYTDNDKELHTTTFFAFLIKYCLKQNLLSYAYQLLELFKKDYTSLTDDSKGLRPFIVYATATILKAQIIANPNPFLLAEINQTLDPNIKEDVEKLITPVLCLVSENSLHTLILSRTGSYYSIGQFLCSFVGNANAPSAQESAGVESQGYELAKAFQKRLLEEPPKKVELIHQDDFTLGMINGLIKRKEPALYLEAAKQLLYLAPGEKEKNILDALFRIVYHSLQSGHISFAREFLTKFIGKFSCENQIRIFSFALSLNVDANFNEECVDMIKRLMPEPVKSSNYDPSLKYFLAGCLLSGDTFYYNSYANRMSNSDNSYLDKAKVIAKAKNPTMTIDQKYHKYKQEILHDDLSQKDAALVLVEFIDYLVFYAQDQDSLFQLLDIVSQENCNTNRYFYKALLKVIKKLLSLTPLENITAVLSPLFEMSTSQDHLKMLYEDVMSNLVFDNEDDPFLKEYKPFSI